MNANIDSLQTPETYIYQDSVEFWKKIKPKKNLGEKMKKNYQVISIFIDKFK